MYTSAQNRAQQPQKPAANRWAFSMLFTRFVQKPIVNEDHETYVVSMREHVMPLMKRFKEDAPTHVRNLLSSKAWACVVDLVKKSHEPQGARYANSSNLDSDVNNIARRLKTAGFKEVWVIAHPNGNRDQINSLKRLLQDHDLQIEISWSGCDAFLKETLIIGQSQYIQDVFEVSYHLDGPKSVPDVEGNDTVFHANFKPTLNHSEAVGVVSWKNYNGFRL